MGRIAMLALFVAMCCADRAVAEETANTNQSERGKAMKEVRKRAAHRRRRMIMNNDGNDCRRTDPSAPKTPDTFLKQRTSPLASSHVDAIFYCTGVFNLYKHNTIEGELHKRWEGEWTWELVEQGRDCLQIMIDFGHEHDMEVFWSMRMNDTHDSSIPQLFCQWKEDHPEYLMGKKGDTFSHGAGRWSAVNYALPEVRDKVFRLLKDVATRYDVDGLELDFFRHPVYFKPQMTGDPVTQEHCDMMTELLRRVRTMTEAAALKRGRPLLIAARVPDSLGYSKAIGLDLIRWLEEDLIDMLVVSGYFHLEPWEEMVKVGHQYDVPVYPCLSDSRVQKGGAAKLRKSLECFRARAMNVWHSGADGLYMFNYFNPAGPIWRELGDSAALQKQDKVYFACVRNPRVAGRWLAGGERYLRLPGLCAERPMNLKPGERRTVTLSVGEDVSASRAEGLVLELTLRLEVTGLADAQDVALKCNGTPLENGELADGWLQFALSPEQIIKGVNRFDIGIRADNEATVVLNDLLLWVRYKKQA